METELIKFKIRKLKKNTPLDALVLGDIIQTEDITTGGAMRNDRGVDWSYSTMLYIGKDDGKFTFLSVRDRNDMFGEVYRGPPQIVFWRLSGKGYVEGGKFRFDLEKEPGRINEVIKIRNFLGKHNPKWREYYVKLDEVGLVQDG